MTLQEDTRWEQRFSNYRKALVKLRQAVEIVSPKLYEKKLAHTDELLREGLVQRFEYTHELAWNVMKDYARYQGFTEIAGSRDAIRKAFEMGLIDDKRWMESIQDRNRTSHTYNDEIAQGILEDIVQVYFPLFSAFESKMEALQADGPKKLF